VSYAAVRLNNSVLITGGFTGQTHTYPQGTRHSNPKFHTHDLHAPAAVARATKFDLVIYHDQTKTFRHSVVNHDHNRLKGQA